MPLPVPDVVTAPVPLMTPEAVKLPLPLMRKVRLLAPIATVAPAERARPLVFALEVPMVAAEPSVMGPTQVPKAATLLVKAPVGALARPEPLIVIGSAAVQAMPLTFNSAPERMVVPVVVVPSGLVLTVEPACKLPAAIMIAPVKVLKLLVPKPSDNVPVPVFVRVPEPCNCALVEAVPAPLPSSIVKVRPAVTSKVPPAGPISSEDGRRNSNPRGIVGHAARDQVARPEARFFWPGPSPARPGLVHFVPGLARPVSRARAWAGTPARGPARLGTE